MIELPIFATLIYAYNLVIKYLSEVLKKRKILSAFKKYVAPQVVEEISKKGEFNIVLGGEKRDIAVLFVDIRGFTPMSEGLKPEEVVEILNEYLNLTTNAIFKNKGTLDKYIGDATMAVFNAPIDLDDYVYRAVLTALDIAKGSEALHQKLMDRFGKSVSFGIGVNCGDAVVGNIGCDFRMDYTAIGDTVNTAARLESNAKPSQILISEEVKKRLEGRIKVTEIGYIPLKGKSKEICVYQLDDVL
ncbi:MAG: adenylate/guanylate cyclase domain-containing protein [Erysipelotrichaceae bacterium]|nr:adenylate/guanylate cyclase domain-containing protein [Erysipelotrichaceae bacterium]